MNTTQRSDEPKAGLQRLRASAGTKIAVAVLVIVVVPVVLVTLVAREREFSPFDEFAHMDYLRRVEQLELPRQGDLRESETLREEMCRGVPQVRRVPCPPADASRADLLEHQVAARAFAYEAQQPPLYYAVTAVLRLGTKPIGSDEVESARLTGIVWLSGGLLVLFFAIRRLGAGYYASLLGCAVVLCSPAMVWQAATVNNDAATVFVGASALLVLGWLRTAEGLRPWVVSAIAAAVCVWLKPTFVVAFVVVALVLAWWRWRTDPVRALAVRLSLLLGAPVLAYLAWFALFATRATASNRELADAILGAGNQTDVFPWREALPSVARMLRVYDVAPLAGYTVPIDSPTVVALAAVLALLILAGGLSWLFHEGPEPAGQQIGIVTMGVLLVLGPAYLLFLYLHYGQSGSAHQRYALVLIPLLAATLAMNAGNRGRVVLAVLIPATLAAQVIALT